MDGRTSETISDAKSSSRNDRKTDQILIVSPKGCNCVVGVEILRQSFPRLADSQNTRDSEAPRPGCVFYRWVGSFHRMFAAVPVAEAAGGRVVLLPFPSGDEFQAAIGVGAHQNGIGRVPEMVLRCVATRCTRISNLFPMEDSQAARGRVYDFCSFCGSCGSLFSRCAFWASGSNRKTAETANAEKTAFAR